MKLLLTSAGITNDKIANALTELVGKPLTEVKAAFILTAKNNRDVPAVEAMSNQIAQLDERNINYVLADPSFDSDWREKLDEAELIIIAGGNTFHLLNEARKTGFDVWLKENLENKVYVGTSAGSIIMTPYIAIASVDDGDENTVGITNLNGLGFVDFEVSPHTPEDVSIEGNLGYSKTTPRKLLLLDNNSAIKVTDDTEIVSDGEWHWCENGKLI
jgi:dipeptidase E